MATIEEKRIYVGQMGTREVYVASGTGLAVASVADDRLGGVELALRGDVRDVAAHGGHGATAADEDALIRIGDEDFENTGFGPAVAVGFEADGDLLAADEGGRIARRKDGDWLAVGTLDAEIRAIDGDLVATSSGVYRVREADLQAVGLADVADVSTPGIPLAATSSGLYRLGNGWMDELDGDFRAVSADPATDPGSLERAHAATRESVFVHLDGEWQERHVPVEEQVVALAVDEGVYAVTDEGTLLIDAGEGFRAHPLGVREVRRVAVA